MAIKHIHLGSMRYVHSYDDTSLPNAIETDGPISAGAAPTTGTQVVRLDDLTSEVSAYFLLAGRAGGQVGYGGIEAGDDLEFYSTSHATKGNIKLSAYFVVDESLATISITNATLTFTGTGHISYGSMSADNISQVVTVSATDTYYEIGGGLSDGGSAGVTFQNSKELKCLTAGKYLVTYSLACYTASAGQEIESEVMINGTAQSNTSNHTESMTANRPMSLSGTGILTLGVNDLVSLSLSNHTSVTNITVEHVTLTLLHIGG